MILDNNNTKPIYVQIAEWLENQILEENIRTNEKMYSQYQLAEMFNINPATAGKGLSLLLDENILYKKRGLGMYVSDNAHDLIFNKRKNKTLKSSAITFITEAKRLGLSPDDMFKLLKCILKELGEENI